MRKLKAIRQPNQMDCGPTCIMIVAEYYGKSASLQTLRSFAGYNKDGVSLSGLADAAEKIGFQTTGVELTLSELMKEVALPAILHWRQNHFVVLGPKPKRTKLVVIDPARGKIDYTVQEFMEGWASNVNEANEPTGTALILQPTDAFYTATEEDAIPQSIGWNFLARYFSRYRKYFFQVILSLGIATLLQLIFPFLTQSIVDTGINSQDLNFITLVLIAQLMLFVSRTLVEFIRSRLLLYISTRINVSILSDFWGKIMRLPISYFDVQRTGDIMQRIGDHRRIEAFLTGPALSTVFSLFTLSVFSIVLLLYSPAIFWVFAGSSILYFLWVMIFLRYRKNLDFKKFDAASRENSITMELIQGVREIKLSASEHLKRWEWERIRVEQFKISFKSLSINQYQQSGAFFINEGKNIFITFLVARLVIDGQLTLGAMLAIQYIIGQLNSPIEQLIAFIQSAQDARISLNRLNDIHQVDDEEPQYRSFRFKLPQIELSRSRILVFPIQGPIVVQC